MVIKAELVGIGLDTKYIEYVFEDLDNPGNYVICTRFPNWDGKYCSLGDKGFIEYQIIKAGSDQWYDRISKEFRPYNYNMVQYLKFIPFSKQADDKTIVD